jgi:hypothetical protein
VAAPLLLSFQAFHTPSNFAVVAQVVQTTVTKMMTSWDDKRVQRYYQAIRLDTDIVHALVDWEKRNGEGKTECLESDSTVRVMLFEFTCVFSLQILR